MASKVHFVINGVEVQVDVASFSSVAFALHSALDLSANLSRPVEDWELRYETGELVEAETIKDLRDETIYVTLKLGCGGNNRAFWIQPDFSGLEIRLMAELTGSV